MDAFTGRILAEQGARRQGGPCTYYAIHHASKAGPTHIGKGLPPGSSALMTFAETTDANRMLAAAEHEKPSVASVASIDADLGAEVSTEADAPAAGGDNALASMIVARYTDPDGAKQVAGRIDGDKKAAESTQVEQAAEQLDGTEGVRSVPLRSCPSPSERS